MYTRYDHYDNDGNEAAVENQPVKKSLLRWIVAIAAGVILVLLLLSSLYTVRENQYAYVTRFSQMVSTTDQPGLKVKMPLLDQVKILPSYLMLYDIPPSEVITADKKTLVVDNFAIWNITDPVVYMKTMNGNQTEMEGRISAAVYSDVKNEFGRLNREEIINTDPTSVEQVSKRVTEAVNKSLSSYGITIKAVEIKRTDLPDANADAVYARMISEREQIAASYLADGNLEAEKIRNDAASETQTILANAQAEANRLNGEAEAEYMKILAEAYNSPEKESFYKYLRSLDALKESLSGSNRVLILDESNYIVQMLMGKNQ